MKTLRRLFLILIFTLAAVPLIIFAQDHSNLVDFPGVGNNDASGKLLTTLDDIPLPPDNSGIGPDDIPLPPDNSDIGPDDIPLPPDNSGIGPDDIPLPPDNSGIGPDDIPMPPDNSGIGPDDIPMPPDNSGIGPDDIPLPPTQPIKLIRGFYKQVGEPKITTSGTCFDKSVDALGSCAADAQGTNEVHDFNNCWSNDPNSPNSKPNDGLIPACQATDSESLYVGVPSQFYGRLTGSAYGHGSSARQMLQEGGVSIASYGIVVGTQIEVLSPTTFVVKYVHREQGGCERVVSVFYTLSGASEAACQQVIEVPPEQQTQDPISTPPPLPPIEDDAPYTVSLPIIPAECTADTRPPEDFKNVRLTLDQGAGTLTINYGLGSYTAYQDIGANFSFVDNRTNGFRLNFIMFGDKISFNWFKTNASGALCSIDGEMRPSAESGETDTGAQMTAQVKDTPYKADWKPVTALCTTETLAALPNFTQATITAGDHVFTVDYGTGSYPLTRQIGSDIYFYMATGADGSTVTVSVNSHSPEKFSLLYQYNDAAGNMCMANLDLTN